MSGEFLNAVPFNTNSERTVVNLEEEIDGENASELRVESFLAELAIFRRLLERKNSEAKASTSDALEASCPKKKKMDFLRMEKEKIVNKISDEASEAYLMEKLKAFVREEKHRERKCQRSLEKWRSHPRNEDEIGSYSRTPEFYRSHSKSPGYRSRSPGYKHKHRGPDFWSPNHDNRCRSLDYDPRCKKEVYDHRRRSPGYDRRRRSPCYDRQRRSPSYDHRRKSPGYDHWSRSPGYDHSRRSPGYDHRGRSPGYDHRGRSPGYDHRGRSPGYNQLRRSPGYDQLRRSLEYALEHQNPEYEVKPNILDEPWRMPEAYGRGLSSPENLTFSNSITIKAESGTLPDAFYCSVCQLSLNSELTWNTHIRGKKHAKALNAQEVHEIAKRSIAVSYNTPPISQDAPRFVIPAAGRKRVPVRDVSRIQRTVEEHYKHPMPGLNNILEIRMDSETSYYCELCDSPCAASSILPHLIGFKHQLRCIKDISPDYYDKVKDRSKKSIERAMVKILYKHEQHYGKGSIKVFEDLPDPSAKPNALNQPGTSWLNSGIAGKHEAKEESEKIAISSFDCLDTSKADFHCKVCDSHMNNKQMWDAHVKGIRHLKNTKKVPGESICKAKTVKAAPNVVSELERRLDREEINELIVGLDYIKETQGEAGETYNCFLCGSCSTDIDIIDHLLQVKHRAKYLEKQSVDGIENAISTISLMDIGDFFREKLIVEECERMVEEYGRGKVEVYIPKKALPPSCIW